MSGGLTHPLLVGCGVVHAFGERDAVPPARVARPRQVHGDAVAHVAADGGVSPADADAIVGTDPAWPVAIVTADCVPILACGRDGRAVAAIHAGWRGLASGVIGAGIAALAEAAGGVDLVAVVGPHIGACCYEVDGPVIDALERRPEASLSEALTPTRPGHWRLDLGAVATAQLHAAGVPGACVASLDGPPCTSCDAKRFHSFRRDGEQAGRLLHHVAPRRGQG